MKKLIKSYYPMFFSISYMFLLSFLMKGQTNNFIALKDGLLMLIFTLLIVGGLFAQMIGFIVHAARNNDLKNKVLWAFGIYFLNIFIMPYYNLKHVMKEKKVALEMVIFTLLMVASIIFGIDLASKPLSDKTVVSNQEYGIQMEFLGTYKENELEDYDLYANDYERDISIGAYVYTSLDDISTEEIHNSSFENIKDSANNVKEIRNYDSATEEKIISSKTYIGEMDGYEFIWNISTVEFTEYDRIVNVVAATHSSLDETIEEEFKNVVESVKYIEE